MGFRATFYKYKIENSTLGVNLIIFNWGHYVSCMVILHVRVRVFRDFLVFNLQATFLLNFASGLP